MQQRGPASVWLAPAPGKDGRLIVRLSAVITVKLTVDGPQPLEVDAVKRLTDSPAWKVIRTFPPAHVALENGQGRWEQTFQIMPLDKGDQPLPLTPLKYRSVRTDWQTAAWQPIPVTVTSVIHRVDASEASDITDIEHLPGPVPWWKYMVWPAASLLAVVLVLAGWWVIRRRQHAATQPADQAALRELDHLLARNLPQAGRGARFCFLIGSIMRRYLERRFQLPVQRQTTAEFLAAMHQAPPRLVPDQELLRDLLERCDLAKFAGVAPTPQECDELAARARRLVIQTTAPVSDKAARDG